MVRAYPRAAYGECMRILDQLTHSLGEVGVGLNRALGPSTKMLPTARNICIFFPPAPGELKRCALSALHSRWTVCTQLCVSSSFWKMQRSSVFGHTQATFRPFSFVVVVVFLHDTSKSRPCVVPAPAFDGSPLFTRALMEYLGSRLFKKRTNMLF